MRLAQRRYCQDLVKVTGAHFELGYYSTFTLPLPLKSTRRFTLPAFPRPPSGLYNV